jgi:hypothetical protein
MVNFILGCMCVVMLSLFAVPALYVFDDISNQRDTITESFTAQNNEAVQNQTDFADNTVEPDPTRLNDIETAAGEEEMKGLPSGFTGKAPSAL